MTKLYVDPIIEKASTIPSSFYTSHDWYEQSKEKIFAKTRQYCLTTEELKQQGQLVPLTLLPGLLDEPILFVRDTSDKLHCVSNVCTHRGNILIESPCISKKIKCRFLTFVLDETKINLGAGAELDRVEIEDEAVVEAVQRGVQSRFYTSGRYSPTMEKGTHHFHRLLCDFLA